MKKILLALVLFLGAGSVGLSYFKNDKIASELTKHIDTISALKHGPLTCKGFVKADCTISDIVYQGLSLADSVTLKGIDPTVQPSEGDFVRLPLEAEIKNAKFSLFDISSMFKNDMQKELKNFFTKYTTDYDITIKANFLTDATTVKEVEIVELNAQDKLTPFILKGKVAQLDTFPILEGFTGAFDLSNKHVVFNDLMKEMRACCKDKIPERYRKMRDAEAWDDMISQTSKALKMNIKNNQFHQGLEIDFMKAMLALLQDEKNTLELQVKSKKSVPLEQTVMMFFIAGPDAVKDVYDIKIKAK